MAASTSTKPIPQLSVMTARQLVAKRLPPIRTIVGRYIPAGLLRVAGDPQAGKTLIMQDLALSIATGQPAWGSLHVDAGSVLYIANEGGERSFRDRIVKMLDLDIEEGDEPETDAVLDIVPERLCITKTDEPLGERLEVQLDWWLTGADDPRLVVIDTYSSVAPEARGANRHQDDYNALSGLADLATRWPNTLFVLIHHTRKAEGEDVMHKISGSNGMSAATDGMAVLSRHTAANQCLLTIRPRNAEECELVVERLPNLRWVIVGDDERSQLSGGRQSILAWLEAHPEGGSPKAIATALGIDYDSVRQFLTQMHDARQVRKPRRGWYEAPKPTASDETDTSTAA
jgi:hypothetical protein